MADWANLDPGTWAGANPGDTGSLDPSPNPVNPVPGWNDPLIDTTDLFSTEFRQMYVDAVIERCLAAGIEVPHGGVWPGGTTISYQVSAIMADGETARSTTATITTPTRTALNPANGGINPGSGVILSWGAVSGARSYRLYRTTGICPAQEIAIVRGTATTWTDTGGNYSVQYPQADQIPPTAGFSATSAPTGLTATATADVPGYTVVEGEDLQQGAGCPSFTAVSTLQTYLNSCIGNYCDNSAGNSKTAATRPFYLPNDPTVDAYGQPVHPRPTILEAIVGSLLWRRRRPRMLYSTDATVINTEWTYVTIPPGSTSFSYAGGTNYIDGVSGWLGMNQPPGITSPATTGMIAEYFEVGALVQLDDGQLFVLDDVPRGQKAGGGGPPCDYQGLIQYNGTTWELMNDQVHNRADILDSQNDPSGGFHIAQGICTWGDYIGPWQFEQMRAVINAMDSTLTINQAIQSGANFDYFVGNVAIVQPSFTPPTHADPAQFKAFELDHKSAQADYGTYPSVIKYKVPGDAYASASARLAAAPITHVTGNTNLWNWQWMRIDNGYFSEGFGYTSVQWQVTLDSISFKMAINSIYKGFTADVDFLLNGSIFQHTPGGTTDFSLFDSLEYDVYNMSQDYSAYPTIKDAPQGFGLFSSTTSSSGGQFYGTLLSSDTFNPSFAPSPLKGLPPIVGAIGTCGMAINQWAAVIKWSGFHYTANL